MNFYMDFIVVVFNLRVVNYEILLVDRYKVYIDGDDD